MLAPATRWNVRRRSLEDLQQRLLNSLTRNVACDRGVVVLATDLVDLVDVDDPLLSFLDIIAGRLQQTEKNVLDVLTDVTRFGQTRRVDDAERNAKNSRERLRKKRLACPGRADKKDVGFLELDVGTTLG